MIFGSFSLLVLMDTRSVYLRRAGKSNNSCPTGWRLSRHDEGPLLRATSISRCGAVEGFQGELQYDGESRQYLGTADRNC